VSYNENVATDSHHEAQQNDGSNKHQDFDAEFSFEDVWLELRKRRLVLGAGTNKSDQANDPFILAQDASF
jgi:hypothetical protein